jgi:hypothetical protein
MNDLLCHQRCCSLRTRARGQGASLKAQTKGLFTMFGQINWERTIVGSPLTIPLHMILVSLAMLTDVGLCFPNKAYLVSFVCLFVCFCFVCLFVVFS